MSLIGNLLWRVYRNTIGHNVGTVVDIVNKRGDSLTKEADDFADDVMHYFTDSEEVNHVVGKPPTYELIPNPLDTGNDLGPNVSDGTSYPDNVESNLFDVNSYFNEALNLARAEQDFNAKEANIARSYNAQEAEKARNFSSAEAALNRSFNAQQALEQREFEERMARTQYQRAIQDMQAAGLNPYLVYAQGGNAVPSGAVASGSAAASSMASGMSAQATNFSSTYLNAITKLTAEMMKFTSNIAGSSMKLLGGLL